MLPAAAIFFCDRTGIMARPWAEAGFECWCIDTAHKIRCPRAERFGSGTINFVWGDVRSFRRPTALPIVFAAGFPPCTHVANCGARDFAIKGGAMLRDALDTFESCRMAASWTGAPYCIENPAGVLVSHIGKWNHRFDPNQFAGYADDPSSEAYTKATFLWTSNGFRFPEFRSVQPSLGSKMHLLTPSDDRADIRAETPQGFARACFIANAPATSVKGIAA